MTAAVAAVIRTAIAWAMVVVAVPGGLGAEIGGDDPPAVAAGAPNSADDPGRPEIYAGRVLGQDDRPLTGARVYLVEDNSSPGTGLPPPPPPGTPPPAVRAVSDGSGRFRFAAADMTDADIDGSPVRHPGLLVAMAEGYGPDWIVTSRVKPGEFLLRLPRDDAPIRGRLLDRAGRPVVGASVGMQYLQSPRGGSLDEYLAYIARAMGNPFLLGCYSFEKTLAMPWAVPGLSSEAATDGEGRFRLVGLGRERVAGLRIRAANVKDTTIQVMTSTAVDRRPMPRAPQASQFPQNAAFAIRLEAGRTVSGVVRDRRTGEPVGGMWVASPWSAWRALVEGCGDVSTDADGRFTLTSLSPDDHHPTLLAMPRPGSVYFMGEVKVDAPGDVVINCPRGIPYTLRLVDEQGAPVEAEVTYYSVYPNPNAWTMFAPNAVDCRFPLGRGARQADGSYRGAVLPGPGVLLAKTPRRAGYRPAHVDPKAFFAPGKTDWTAQELISTYGNQDTVSITHLGGMAWVDQHEYAAIVLVNPPAESRTLELAATVVRDRPRQVHLVDPEGKPLVGVQGDGLKYHPYARDPRLLRSSTVSLHGLHPDRVRRILFVHEPRKLSGTLLARGDGDTPYTVRLLPWCTITGRLVDGQGRPIAGAFVAEFTEHEFAAHDDPTQGRLPEGIETDQNGRFRIDRLVPGLAYTAQVYKPGSKLRGTAFRGIKVAPGLTRDLGDIVLGDTPAEK